MAFFAEGPSDHRFLDRIIERTMAAEMSHRGLNIDIGPLQRLPPSAGQGRADRITEGALAMQGGFHVLFVHSDAGANARLACDERIEPGRRRILQHLGEGGRRIVGVVPARETEAWALADCQALARVLATELPLNDYGVPSNPRQVERLADPKATLDAVVAAARGGRRRRRTPKGADFLDRLADEIDLPRLERVPSYSSFKAKLGIALNDLLYV